MKKYTKKRTVFLIAFLLALSTLVFLSYMQAGGVCAQGLWDLQRENMEKVAPVFESSVSNPRDIRAVAVDIIKVFLTLIGVIMIIIIILAGVKWMTAAGNQDRVSQARQQLQNAIIGLIIILAAYTITEFLAGCVFRIINGPWICR